MCTQICTPGTGVDKQMDSAIAFEVIAAGTYQYIPPNSWNYRSGR